MSKKVSLKRAALVDGPKEVAAIALIYKGIEMIEAGDLLLGGGMVVAGGILIVIDQVM